MVGSLFSPLKRTRVFIKVSTLVTLYSPPFPSARTKKEERVWLFYYDLDL